MYRFLASTRWVGWLLLVTIFAGVCAALSWWQWDRRAETAQENARVTANWDATPRDFAQVSDWFDTLPQERTYTPVRLEGRYLPEQTTYVRQRTLSSALGMEVLVPFRTDEGEVVLVDRGWMANGSAEDQHPDDVPAPPAGEVTVTVRVIIGEPDIGKDAPSGQVASVDLPGIAEMTGLPLHTGAYGMLDSERPAPATTPTPLPIPEADEGMHWSYGFQWAAFGVLFFVAFGYAARQQAKISQDEREALERGDDQLLRARRMPRAKPVKPRRDGTPHDEEIEDALVDAAERSSASGPASGN